MKMRDRHHFSKVNGHELHTTPPDQRPPPRPFVYQMAPRSPLKPLPAAPPAERPRSRITLAEYMRTRATDAERRLMERLGVLA